jgi:hypothetical protein
VSTPEIRIERGAPDDVEIAAVVAALGVLVSAAEPGRPDAAAVTWLRSGVLVPAEDWTSDRVA